MKNKPSIILLAVTGMSPAILTETVWALAREKKPIIPDRVVALTTRLGQASIERELLASNIWNGLRKTLLGRKFQSDPRLSLQLRLLELPDPRHGANIPLDDIRSGVENRAVGDQILEVIRSFTENPQTLLIASIAGGRKTMGVLLYAGMSLLGRPEDRVTHVLVNDPFDHPALQPRFYYPTSPPTEHLLPASSHPDHRRLSSSRATITLADIPFVPLRKLFPGQLGDLPGNFSDLVSQYAGALDELALDDCRFDLNFTSCQWLIGGKAIRVNGRELSLLAHLQSAAPQGGSLLSQHHTTINEDLKRHLPSLVGRFPESSRAREHAATWSKSESEDIRKVLSGLRSKLRKQGLVRQERTLLPPHH